ncbi:Aspartokinase 1, chloroplastic, partial [Tetrabaena socialis]
MLLHSQPPCPVVPSSPRSAPVARHAGSRGVAAQAAAAVASPRQEQAAGQGVQQVNVVYKFGGSSVRDAARMREVADIITSFPEYTPCVVLSAMGKTTNLLLECGDLALRTSTDKISQLEPL